MTRYANMEEAMKGTGEGEWYEEVLTLRDQFAMHAPEMTGLWYGQRPAKEALHDSIAAWAYEFADAMLAARKREKSE